VCVRAFVCACMHVCVCVCVHVCVCMCVYVTERERERERERDGYKEHPGGKRHYFRAVAHLALMAQARIKEVENGLIHARRVVRGHLLAVSELNSHHREAE
jgi:hypothetical protein